MVVASESTVIITIIFITNIFVTSAQIATMIIVATIVDDRRHRQLSEVDAANVQLAGNDIADQPRPVLLHELDLLLSPRDDRSYAG